MPLPSRTDVPRAFSNYNRFKRHFEALAMHIRKCFDCMYRADLIITNHGKRDDLLSQICKHAHEAGFKLINFKTGKRDFSKPEQIDVRRFVPTPPQKDAEPLDTETSDMYDGDDGMVTDHDHFIRTGVVRRIPNPNKRP